MCVCVVRAGPFQNLVALTVKARGGASYSEVASSRVCLKTLKTTYLKVLASELANLTGTCLSKLGGPIEHLDHGMVSGDECTAVPVHRDEHLTDTV